MSDPDVPHGLHITVVSDVVCPWCFIGLHHLESALADWRLRHPGRPEPVVEWSAFQLNPDLDRVGVERDAYVRAKFGARHDEVMDRMAAAGEQAGIRFDWSRIKRQPNTLALHALILETAGRPQQHAVARALFQAFFLDGVDMTSATEVAGALASVGVSQEQVERCWLQGAEPQIQAERTDAQWRARGVQGVPLFVFNHRWAVSGAQPPAQLVHAMEQALSEVNPA